MNDEIIREIINDIRNENKKVIGWGAGGYFANYDNIFHIKLDYIIDSNESKWNSEFYGFKIKGPDSLKEEDPEKTIIIIYSTFPAAIEKMIKSYGNFAFVLAPVVFSYNMFNLKRKRIKSIIANNKLKEKYSSESGIVIQGPVYKDTTLEIVRYYATMYPKDCLILSTWDDSNEEEIKELRKYVDYCILNKKPANGGVGNRFFQIESTLAGIKKAKEIGLKKVLKTRTDMMVYAEDILNQCSNIQKLYKDSECEEYGAKNRIVIPSSYTCKYKPYFTTDFAMYGNVEDIFTYWNLDYNSGDKDFEIYEPERLFGRKYCESLGWNMKNTNEDWWEFCKKFFIVTDDKWFDLTWYKHPIIPSWIEIDSSKECISHYFWQQLYFKNK